jgi:hypothetical protein
MPPFASGVAERASIEPGKQSGLLRGRSGALPSPSGSAGEVLVGFRLDGQALVQVQPGIKLNA